MFRFHIEHIIPKQHGGGDEADNRALASYHCNWHKGPNLAGLDPESGRLAPLFHPRRQRWDRHFAWEGPYLRGRTAVGRATITVLRINQTQRVSLRERLMGEGVF